MDTSTTRMLLVAWALIALVFGVGVVSALRGEAGNQAGELSRNERGLPGDERPAATLAENIASWPPVSVVDFDTGNCPAYDDSDGRVVEYNRAVDKTTPVGEYVPVSLVDISAHIPTKHRAPICIEKLVAGYLYDMVVDAREQGVSLVVASGYRSSQAQELLRNRSMRRFGQLEYDRVAPVGHSEHQLGLAVDFTTAEIAKASAARAFVATEAYAWLVDHADEYGFYLSYPEGQEEETGYIFEPWHWRFGGWEARW